MDRAGDALKHGNAYGASPHGGVLMVAGDDHGCVSSSMPHQSDQAFQSWHAPIVAPANVAEYLEFGLYGWALSRFSGNWVGFTALSEVVESGSTVDLVNARVATWQDADTVRAHRLRAAARRLHYRWPDLPSLTIEQRLHAKLDAVRAFARVNSIDRHVVQRARHGGIVTAGKAHYDRRCCAGWTSRPRRWPRTACASQAGPHLPDRADAHAGVRARAEGGAGDRGEGPVVEEQLRSLFYNAASGR